VTLLNNGSGLEIMRGKRELRQKRKEERGEGV
jgi:hypothetical protein